MCFVCAETGDVVCFVCAETDGVFCVCRDW